MKKFETLWELPKCNTETQSKQTLLEKQCQQTCSKQGCHRASICKNCIKYIRVKTIKHLEYRSKPLWPWVKQSLLRLRQKRKKDKLDYIDINICSTNNIIKKVKKSTKLDKMF